MKIMHIAYGHRTDDTRILKKECVSLAKSGYEVIYVTSDKLSKDTSDFGSVKRIILPLRSNDRLKRLSLYMRDVKKLVKREKPDVCHIHDFQIITLILHISGITKCVFDSHEDHPGLIADSQFKRLNYRIKYEAVKFVERICFRKCVFVVAATPYIRQQIAKIASKVIDVNNYPVLEHFGGAKEYDASRICFTGGTGVSSGLINVAKAIKNTAYKLVIAGNCSEDFYEELMKQSGGNVEYLGYLDKSEVDRVIESSLVGIVTYMPTVNNSHALPNKMFEYMERGTPIIYSSFPDWIDMLNKYNVGISVDPGSPEEIKKALDSVCINDHYRSELSRNAREAIESVFNWKNEEKKLLEAYNSLIS